MMKIEDLLFRPADLRGSFLLSEVNPLVEDDALQEAQFIDVRFDALSGVVGIIFDLRFALQLREAGTGVFVASGVSELVWSGPVSETVLTAWTVEGSIPRMKGDRFNLELSMWPAPGGESSVTAQDAVFFIGHTAELSGEVLDYGEHDRVSVSRGTASWSSLFKPVSAAYLNR